MEATNVIFIIYGIAIIAISSFGVYQPKTWIGFVEKQFIYRRERFTAGGILLALGILPLYFLAGNSGFQNTLAIILAAVWIILSIPILTFYDPLRNAIISLAELKDLYLQLAFGADVAVGIILILVGVF